MRPRRIGRNQPQKRECPADHGISCRPRLVHRSRSLRGMTTRIPMTGHIRRRGERSWELKFDLGRDPGGKRQIRYHSFKGTKKEAHLKLAELIASVGKGSYVSRSY